MLGRHDVTGLPYALVSRSRECLFTSVASRVKPAQKLQRSHTWLVPELRHDQDGEDSAPEEQPREEDPRGPGTLPERAGSLLQRAVSGAL